jgi:hypothetical protein
MAVMAGPSLLSSKGMEALPKKARLEAFLLVSTRYVCGVAY